jgi:hypothetical protein
MHGLVHALQYKMTFFLLLQKGWPQFAAASNKGYLPMVGGSLRLLPSLKLVAMI